MAVWMPQNVTNDRLSSFALCRKQIASKWVSSRNITLSIQIRPQISGLVNTISAIALMVFSNYLNPFFGFVSICVSAIFLGATVISSLRECFSSLKIKFDFSREMRNILPQPSMVNASTAYTVP